MGLSFVGHGERMALLRMANRQLEKKFGPLPSSVKERLETFSIAQLEQVLMDLLEAQSLKDLALDQSQEA
jgi:Domain of unknown function (DUF4351)